MSQIWRATQIALGCLNLAVMIVLGHAALKGAVPFAAEGRSPVIEYKDFVTILLTAIAVMLAILTIFLAAAAIWGFNELKKVAKEEADVVSARNNSELKDQVRGNPHDIGEAAGGTNNE